MSDIFEIMSRDETMSYLADIVQQTIDITNPPIPMVACKVDGNTDDTAALQALVNYCVSTGKKLRNPVFNNYCKCTSPINITGSIEIEGGGQYTGGFIFVGCSGFIISNGVGKINFHDFEIALGTRYTTTVNSYVGITFNGDTTHRPFNNILKDIYIDGFETAINTSYMWSSLFDNVKTGYCHRAILVNGLSVNNLVINCSLSVDGTTGSRGVAFLGNAGTEGWNILNSVIDSAEIGIYGLAVAHIKIIDCIIDHCTLNGILIKDNILFASNFTIHGNYIGMQGTGGLAGIQHDNNVDDPQNRGNSIYGNHIIAYSGATCTYGIYLSGTYSKNNIVDGNTIKNMSSIDIRSVHANNTIVNNQCLSSVTNNIFGGDLVSNNIGNVYYERSLTYIKLGMVRITYDEAIPTVGTWNKGDRCLNINPAVGSPKGWICTVAGTPGTWVSEGNL